MESGGPPLCVIATSPTRAATVELAPGDWLCVVTDGVTEAMNERRELYGVGAAARTCWRR